jgi:hypothetical protein
MNEPEGRGAPAPEGPSDPAQAAAKKGYPLGLFGLVGVLAMVSGLLALTGLLSLIYFFPFWLAVGVGLLAVWGLPGILIHQVTNPLRKRGKSPGLRLFLALLLWLSAHGGFLAIPMEGFGRTADDLIFTAQNLAYRIMDGSDFERAQAKRFDPDGEKHGPPNNATASAGDGGPGTEPPVQGDGGVITPPVDGGTEIISIPAPAPKPGKSIAEQYPDLPTVAQPQDPWAALEFNKKTLQTRARHAALNTLPHADLLTTYLEVGSCGRLFDGIRNCTPANCKYVDPRDPTTPLTREVRVGADGKCEYQALLENGDLRTCELDITTRTRLSDAWQFAAFLQRSVLAAYGIISMDDLGRDKRGLMPQGSTLNEVLKKSCAQKTRTDEVVAEHEVKTPALFERNLGLGFWNWIDQLYGSPAKQQRYEVKVHHGTGEAMDGGPGELGTFAFGVPAFATDPHVDGFGEVKLGARLKAVKKHHAGLKRGAGFQALKVDEDASEVRFKFHLNRLWLMLYEPMKNSSPDDRLDVSEALHEHFFEKLGRATSIEKTKSVSRFIWEDDDRILMLILSSTPDDPMPFDGLHSLIPRVVVTHDIAAYKKQKPKGW